MSVLIGAVIILDGMILRRSSGVNGVTPLLTVTATIEFLWAVVSITALVKLKFTHWNILIPTAYVTYNILGWLYGVVIALKIDKGIDEQAFSVPTLSVPMWYVNFCITFGIVFTLSCIVAIVM